MVRSPRRITATQRELERSLLRLEGIHALDVSLRTASTVEDVANVGARHLRTTLALDRVVVGLLNEDGATMSVLADDAIAGSDKNVPATLRVADMINANLATATEARFWTDLRSAVDDFPTASTLVEAGMTSGALLPLREAGRSIGFVGLLSIAPRTFSAHDVAIMLESTGPLTIAIREARARELVAGRERRLTALHQLDKAILDAASPEQIAERAHDHLRDIFPSDQLVVLLVDATRAELTAYASAGTPERSTTGSGPDVTATRLVVPLTPAFREFLRTFEDGTPRTFDAADLPDAERTPAAGIKVLHLVPLMADSGALAAAILLGSRDANWFTTERTMVADEVGVQLTIALRQATLRADRERAAVRLQGLRDLDLAILAARAPEEIAQVALEHLGRLIPADVSSIRLYDIDAGEAVLLARVADVAMAASDAVDVVGPIAPWVPLPELLAEAEGVIPLDLDRIPGLGAGLLRARDAGYRHLLVVPLHSASGLLIGAIHVSSRDADVLDGDAAEVLAEVGAQVEIALRQALARESLERREVRLEGMHRLDVAILGAVAAAEVARVALLHLRRLVWTDGASVMLFDLGARTSTLLAAATETAPTEPPAIGATRPIADLAPLAELLESATSPVELRLAGTPELGAGLENARRLGFGSVLSIPLRDDDGRLTGALNLASMSDHAFEAETVTIASEVGALLEIALRQGRFREELSEREARMRSILEGSPNPIMTVEATGTIGYANPAALQAFRFDDLVGRPIAELVPAATRARHRSHVADWFTSPHPGRMTHLPTVDAVRSDGTLFPVAAELAAVSGTHGVQAVVTLVDMSDRIALERHMAHAQRIGELGQFAAILAHDVRSYFSAIAWSAESLDASLATDDSRKADVTLILRAVEEARDMIRSILEFARPDAPVGETDLGAHVARIGGIIARLLGSDVALEVDIPPHLPPVALGSAAVTQMLLNFATNARQAMPDGGSFRIGAVGHERVGVARGRDGDDVHDELPPGRYVRLTIADTGIGMDRETSLRAFETYYTTGPGEQGVGLGLASVFVIVTRAGGAIAVESAPSMGTTFVVDLPVAVTVDADAGLKPSG